MNQNKKIAQKNIHINKKQIERAYLIGLFTNDQNRMEYLESMEELKKLAYTAETEVINTFVQQLEKANSSTWIGKGKLQEILRTIKQNSISTLIFNDNLSPAQARNIAKMSKCNIVDRTELILDIFSKHAKSKESKIQVELAQLEYSYSKLRNLWQHFSRIEGGIGVRGPGEKQIEIDRRMIKKRITLLKSKLIDIKKTTENKRKRRNQAISVCLVGYTNAGKSTLFNLLTEANIYTADKLFATLDATTRSVKIPMGEELIITDTIGFINHLPTTLVQSFYSTLYEVREADLLLHVVDVSHTRIDEMISTVNNVLTEIKASDKNVLYVFNKWDLLEPPVSLFLRKYLQEKYEDCVFISARDQLHVDSLYEKIIYYINQRKVRRFYQIPPNLGNLIDFIQHKTTILDSHYNEENNTFDFDLLIDFKHIKNVEEQISKCKLINYINS